LSLLFQRVEFCTQFMQIPTQRTQSPTCKSTLVSRLITTMKHIHVQNVATTDMCT